MHIHINPVQKRLFLGGRNLSNGWIEFNLRNSKWKACIMMSLCKKKTSNRWQGDKSTAVHLAASNGSIEIMRLMIDRCEEQVRTCLVLKDVNGRQPLHVAALCDRADFLQLFIDLVSKPFFYVT